MKSITEYTREEAEQMRIFREKTLGAARDLKREDYFPNFEKRHGYAHYEFSGKFNDTLVERLGHEPTSDEIIILVDWGFSHFGAKCQISGNKFSGRVNTD